MMNKRYTDIDALTAMLRNNIDLPFNGGDSWAHIVQIKDKLIEHIEKNAPVADVVEVVRCGECIHHLRIEVGEVTSDACRRRAFMPCNPEDYCSYGKRKDGGNNAAD